MNNTNIELTRGYREDAGSCNACQTRERATVIVVSLKSLTFRLCDPCARRLAASLEKRLCA